MQPCTQIGCCFPTLFPLTFLILISYDLFWDVLKSLETHYCGRFFLYFYPQTDIVKQCYHLLTKHFSTLLKP